MPRFSHRRSLQFTFLHVFSPTVSQRDFVTRKIQWTFCFLNYSSRVLCTRNQRVMVSQDIENIQSIILNMHGLAQRHTAQTFGRDSAAISAMPYTDWLSVACTRRLSPIQSHERPRADSIEAGLLEWVILLEWLGSEKENRR